MSLQNALNCSAAMDLNSRRTDQESGKGKGITKTRLFKYIENFTSKKKKKKKKEGTEENGNKSE